MAEENKEEKKEKNAAPEKKADESKESKEKSKETEDSKQTKESDQEDKTDWKKKAQEERDARQKAEKALAEGRYKKSEARRKQTDEGTEKAEEEEKPLTESQLRNILQQERATTRKEALSSQTREIARKHAGSDDEADAIVEIYNSRTLGTASSTHEERVLEAFYIAHGPRILAKLSEMRRSLQSKDTKGKGGSENVHRDARKGDEPSITAQDKAEMQRLGFTWDGKLYTKKLPSGKILVKKSLKDKGRVIKG